MSGNMSMCNVMVQCIGAEIQSIDINGMLIVEQDQRWTEPVHRINRLQSSRQQSSVASKNSVLQPYDNKNNFVNINNHFIRK